MKISVLFTDLDGTLLEPDGRLAPRTASTVARSASRRADRSDDEQTESELRAWLEVSAPAASESSRTARDS